MPITRTIAVALALFALTASAPAQSITTVDAGRGDVTLFLPTDYSPSEPLPLIILLHGFTNTGEIEEAKYNLSQRVNADRFLYAIPTGNSNFLGQTYWNAGACCDLFGGNPDDSSYLRNLVTTIQSQYSVDPRRIHFMGFSNGGFMAYRMACEHADLVASILVHAGQSDLDFGACMPTEALSVLHIHSQQDGVINYNGGCIPFGGCYPSAPQSTANWAAYNNCFNMIEQLPGTLDLDAAVIGEETSKEIYRTGCDAGVEVEFWTMLGSAHSPQFVDSGAGEGPLDNRLAPLAIDWLFAHPKPIDCPGDADGNGFTNTADITFVVSNLGAGVPGAEGTPGDANGDGETTTADLTLVVSNLGTVCD